MANNYGWVQQNMQKSGNIALALAMLLAAALFALRQYHASGAPLRMDGALGYTLAPYALLAIPALLSLVRTPAPSFLKSLRTTALLMLLATIAGYADFASHSTGGLAFIFLPGLLCAGGAISLLVCDLAWALRPGGASRDSPHGGRGRAK